MTKPRTTNGGAGRRSTAILPGRTLAALLVALSCTVAIAGLSYRSLQQREEAIGWVNHTNQVKQQLTVLGSDLKDAETGQRGFLLTGTERYLEPYERARTLLGTELAAVRRFTDDNPEEQQRLDRLGPLITDKLAELAETIALKTAGKVEEALALVRTDRGKVAMDQAVAIIKEMTDAEDRLLDRRTAEWQHTVTIASYTIYGGSGLIVLMLFLTGWLASKDYRAREAEAWIRSVQADLAEGVQGDLRVESLGEKALGVLVASLDAQVGALYATEPGNGLRRIAGHALDPSTSAAETLKVGDGLLGQAAKEGQLIHLREVPADYLHVNSAVGNAKPREVVIVPTSVDGTIQAVAELGFFHDVEAPDLEVLHRVSVTIATAIRSARDRSRLEELLEETQRQGEELQTQQEELRVQNEELEASRRTLQVSQTQLQEQQAELEQINSQLEEQTQSLERQRDELARAGTDLQRTSVYKSEFLANMSHELRTPLNSSLILAKLLSDNREGNLNEEQIKFAQTIYSAGNDLLTLINDILDLSKIEAGKLEVRPERVPLARVFDELSNTFSPIAGERHLSLTMRVDGAVDALETDPNRLNQILKNLLSNALKFTERGGVTLLVTATPGGLHFAVEDTGIGIAADQHEAIFEAFRQADGATNRKYGGTGLGLSISRDLARLLGGDLAVESAPGRGSTFTLTLPQRFAGRQGGIPIAPKPAPPPVVPVAAPRSSDDRATVTPTSRSLLVIEDDPAFAKILDDVGHELEFQVLIAGTAEEGLAMARQYRPSAIVLDNGLPDRFGLSVLDVLKRDPATRHIPVHMISASDFSKVALEMGAAGYALKPIERDKLLEAIQHLEAKFTQKLRRVLIVEDDPTLRESTARLLASDGVETIAVGTTAEALEKLRALTFDCMVLDLSLPDRSGLDLLEEISGGDQYGVPPVIVYTGRSMSQEQVHELERFSRSIIIKGARSPERLLDEVTLFLHQVEATLPPERQRMLRTARNREAVFEGRSILIVEDDVRNVFALTSVLEPRGAKIEIARNGREAIEHVRRNPNIDLVLMDIMMPEMDGLEATRELRKHPEYAKLPIIALTAKAMIDDREKCLEAGANDYIAKPLDIDKLLSLARVWIRK